MNAWYSASTGNDQGLIIDEQTGENIAVTYRAENAEIVASAPELCYMLGLALKYLEHPDVLSITENMAMSGRVVNNRIRLLLEKITELQEIKYDYTR